MDQKRHYHSSSRNTSGSRGGWVRGICEVDWSCVFLIISLGIATGVLQKAAAVPRPIFLGDATIAYPHRASNSIEFWVALVVPALVLLASAAVLEFLAFKQQQGWRQAWLNLLNVALAMLAALAVAGFLTELFKRICGRLRPDFLDRCQPTQLPAGANPVAYGTFPDVSCTALPGSQLRDGRMSFPSGHASCSMVVGLFGALYLLWSVHLRAHSDALGPVSVCRNGALCMRAWLRAELLRLLVLLVVLFQLAWPWGVAVSRFRDNRHNVSDVVGGLLLGACAAPLFMARLAWHVSGWAELQQQEASGLQLQIGSVSPLPVGLPPTSSSSEYAAGQGGSHGNGHPVAMVDLHA